MVERAEKDLLTPPPEGKDPPTLKEMMAALTMAQDFLIKLPKLRPADDDNDEAGISLMRDMLADPAAVVERLHANPVFMKAMKMKGWLPPPARPHHRPTRDQSAEREEYQARQREVDAPPDDDSELSKMLARAQNGATPQ